MLNALIQKILRYCRSLFLFVKGDMLSATGRQDNAIDCLNQAISIRPQASYYKAKGMIHHNIGEYEEAIDAFNFIAKNNTQDVEVYIMRMRSFDKIGEYEEAFLDCCTVIEMSPLFGRIEVARIRRLILEKIKIKRRTKLKNIVLPEDAEIDYCTLPEFLSVIIGSVSFLR